eukprot:scaffold3070_cov200-Ochromonas_danica.AAC.2
MSFHISPESSSSEVQKTVSRVPHKWLLVMCSLLQESIDHGPSGQEYSLRRVYKPSFILMIKEGDNEGRGNLLVVLLCFRFSVHTTSAITKPLLY